MRQAITLQLSGHYFHADQLTPHVLLSLAHLDNQAISLNSKWPHLISARVVGSQTSLARWPPELQLAVLPTPGNTRISENEVRQIWDRPFCSQVVSQDDNAALTGIETSQHIPG